MPLWKKAAYAIGALIALILIIVSFAYGMSAPAFQ
jgi:demethoxyubiquinone hydroxylase (CLK1/Coq7/Cat5 family)